MTLEFQLSVGLKWALGHLGLSIVSQAVYMMLYHRSPFLLKLSCACRG